MLLVLSSFQKRCGPARPQPGGHAVPQAVFFLAAAGFRLVMRPDSVPALSSISALISVGLRDFTASSSAFFSS
jgi:hypothetical protein